MTAVTLTSYFRKEDQVPSNLVIRSVEPPLPGIPLPSGGRFTGFYGTRDTLQLLGEARLNARKEGKNLARVDMHFEAGDYGVNKATADSLVGSRVLNFFRMNRSLENLLLSRMGLDAMERNLMVAVARDPQRLNTLFELPMCRDVDAIVWGFSKKPLAELRDGEFALYERSSAFYQLMTLRNTDVIENIDVRNFDWEMLGVEAD